jgi:Homeodomain-like domain-containing protein
LSIVWACPLDVDTYIKHGRGIETPRPACPLCAGATGSWSGYERHLRDERDRLIWIPRVRCGACGVTQALLPWFVVARRWDVVEVIGRALELAAEGWGHRRIARAVGRPETTVRDWCRRFRGRAALVASVLLGRAVSWGWSGWELPTAPLARCRAAVEAVAGQWQRRRGPVERWRPVNLITGGWLLVTNTSPLLAAGQARSWMSAKSKQEVPNGP